MNYLKVTAPANQTRISSWGEGGTQDDHQISEQLGEWQSHLLKKNIKGKEQVLREKIREFDFRTVEFNLHIYIYMFFFPQKRQGWEVVVYEALKLKIHTEARNTGSNIVDKK